MHNAVYGWVSAGCHCYKYSPQTSSRSNNVIHSFTGEELENYSSAPSNASQLLAGSRAISCCIVLLPHHCGKACEALGSRQPRAVMQACLKRLLDAQGSDLVRALADHGTGRPQEQPPGIGGAP